MDKIFLPGDKALVVIDYTGDMINFINIIDHYRINLEIILFLAFVLLLVVFAGWTGIKAVLSFVMTILMIWKVLIPFFLKVFNPIILSLLVVLVLTGPIIFLVGGINRRSLVAVMGSLSGSLLTCILAIIFGRSFKIHGVVLPFSESLLYSGYMHKYVSAEILHTIIGSFGLVTVAPFTALLSGIFFTRPDF